MHRFHPGISLCRNCQLIVESYSFDDLCSRRTILKLNSLPDGAKYQVSIWPRKLQLSFQELQEASVIVNDRNGLHTSN